ncbi:MAG: MerR family transcriptional regulator [Paracoccaceae bacterium]
MKKAPDAFRTISEVADWLDVQAHVLRFWESKFTQVKPVKRAGGRRYYRPADMLLIGGIKALLHDDGMTIKGVQKVLREKGVDHVSSFSRPIDGEDAEAETQDNNVIEAQPTETPEITATPPTPEPEAEAPLVEDAAPVEDPPNVLTFQSRKTRSAPTEPAPEPVDQTAAKTDSAAADERVPDPQDAVSDEPADAPETAVDDGKTDIVSDAASPASVTPAPEDQEVTPAPAEGTEEPVEAVADAPAPDIATGAESPDPETEESAPETVEAKAKPRRVRSKSVSEPMEPGLFDDLPEQPKLPSFLHRGARQEPDPEPEVETEPKEEVVEAGPPKPAIVDAPDPPSDDEIEAAPGVLGRLSSLQRLPPASIEQLGPLAAELRARVTASGGTPNGPA